MVMPRIVAKRFGDWASEPPGWAPGWRLALSHPSSSTLLQSGTGPPPAPTTNPETHGFCIGAKASLPRQHRARPQGL